jgi:hypothetical protein
LRQRAFKSFDRCAKPRHGLLQSVSLGHRGFGPLAPPLLAGGAAVLAHSDGQLCDSVVTILQMVNKPMILHCVLPSGCCIYRQSGGSHELRADAVNAVSTRTESRESD